MKIFSLLIGLVLLSGVSLAMKNAPEEEFQPVEIVRIDMDSPQEIAWNADLSRVAVSTGFEIQVRDALTWEVLFTIPKAYVYAIGWHPEQNLIAGIRSGGYKLSILLWDGSTGQLVRTMSRTVPDKEYGGAWVSSILEWSPDSKTIATEGITSPVLLWDVETNVRTPSGWSESSENPHGLTELAWSQNGDYLAGAGYPTLRVWNVATGENVLAVPGYKFVTWHPDGVRFAGAGLETAVNVWNAETGELEVQFLRHTRTITGLDWHPDGSVIASTDYTGKLFVWDSQTGLTVCAMELENLMGVAWKPDGLQLAVITYDAIHIYSWKSFA